MSISSEPVRQWTKERKKYFQRNGQSAGHTQKRKKGEDTVTLLAIKDKNVKRQE